MVYLLKNIRHVYILNSLSDFGDLALAPAVDPSVEIMGAPALESLFYFHKSVPC